MVKRMSQSVTCGCAAEGATDKGDIGFILMGLSITGSRAIQTFKDDIQGTTFNLSYMRGQHGAVRSNVDTLRFVPLPYNKKVHGLISGGLGAIFCTFSLCVLGFFPCTKVSSNSSNPCIFVMGELAHLNCPSV